MPACLPACRYLTLAQAQAKPFVVDWKDPINKPVRPAVIGTKVYKAFPIEDVVDYIDWNPFFQVRLACSTATLQCAATGCCCVLQLSSLASCSSRTQAPAKGPGPQCWELLTLPPAPLLAAVCPRAPQVWQLRGRYPNRGYPKIFNDATVGSEAKKLFEEAQEMLADFVKNKRVELNGIVGFYPANSDGDDVEVRVHATCCCFFAVVS